MEKKIDSKLRARILTPSRCGPLKELVLSQERYSFSDSATVGGEVADAEKD
jgi:hypothetical protein